MCTFIQSFGGYKGGGWNNDWNRYAAAENFVAGRMQCSSFVIKIAIRKSGSVICMYDMHKIFKHISRSFSPPIGGLLKFLVLFLAHKKEKVMGTIFIQAIVPFFCSFVRP